MRISDWSSDVCSSDLEIGHAAASIQNGEALLLEKRSRRRGSKIGNEGLRVRIRRHGSHGHGIDDRRVSVFRENIDDPDIRVGGDIRSDEHTSELQSLMRISYAVFCLKKQHTKQERTTLYTVEHHNNN